MNSRKKLKAQLEAEYKVPVYSKWDQVPPTLFTRTNLKEKGIDVPRNTPPDAIKNSYPSTYYFLFYAKRPEAAPAN